MARQRELFPKPETTINVDGSRGEPRLWVRRLVIWEKPGEIIREVHLRRGLNIIWSPDPGADSAELGRDAGSGHGAGKTLFCRLLRYCLGEDSFSNDELRKSIAELLPTGLVGAELVIAGKQWAVIRPIGHTRKHVAREGASLEDIALMKESGGSIQPLLAVLRSHLFAKGIEDYLPGEREYAAWLFALAWLSRDQECRFDHILDWRHPRADTGSVAVGPTKDQLLVVVRAFLGMIEQGEVRLKAEREQLPEKKKPLEREMTYLQRRRQQLSSELVQAFDIGHDIEVGDELGLALLRETAESRLRESEKQESLDDVALLTSYRQEREGILKEKAVCEKELERFNAMRALHEEQLKPLRGERSNLDGDELRARLGPVCPVCSVPIDQALAQGCGLSNRFWDPTSIRDEKHQVAEQMAACNQAILRVKTLASEHTAMMNNLDRREADLADEIRALEKKIKDAERQQRERWFNAKQLVAKASALYRAQTRILETKTSLDELVDRDKELANSEAQYRSRHGEIVSRLRELFSYVCRGLLGNQVSVSLVLSGNGLQAEVAVGGMAMESLKAIAFDLAALLMSIEGRTMLPAFLIHDSPREADLGESIYHRLFRFVHSLETLSDDPPFQYVITTTSEPPIEFCQLPFLIAKLHGSEVDGRLLRRNLGSLET